MNTRYLLIPSMLYVSLFMLSCATPAPHSTRVPTKTPMPTYESNRTIVHSQTATTGGLPAIIPMPPPTGYTQPTYGQSTQPAYTQPSQPTASETQRFGSFWQWRDAFVGRMAQTTPNAREILGNASFDTGVVNLDNNQAEFSQMVWEYLDKRVTSNVANQGIQKRREMLDTLTRAENRYGVPASIVTAIWGLESSYGGNMGRTDLVDALSSLAYDGRRRSWAEGQLASALQLVSRGDVSRHELRGSYAGGMGHTQFIPGTWLVQGVDADGDGRRNPFSRADALTSTANYLANSGWVQGVPAYYEVRLPSNFNYQYIGTRQSLNDWQRLGLTTMSGELLSGSVSAELWLPAGINGPILLTTPSFEAIKAYNNSSNYALAVAALANRINSRPAFVTPFPTHERGLSRAQVTQLQQLLTSRGYDTQGVDGVIGANTRKAFARWQYDNRRIPDGFISQSSVAGLLW